MVTKKKKPLSHAEVVKKAGKRTLELHGKEHYRQMGLRSGKAKRARAKQATA